VTQDEFDANKRVDKFYGSPSLPAFGDPSRKVRIVSKVTKSSDDYAFIHIKNAVVLRYHPGSTKYIKATFFEDDRSIRVLNIQGFSAATHKPHNASFSFIGNEIGTLVEFLNAIQTIPLDDPGSINVTDARLRQMVLSPEQAATLLDQNEQVLTEALRQRVTKEDLVAVGYRKKQLDVFRRLLDEDSFFQAAMAKHQASPEAVWQRFFERNTWMFGYGLGYLFLSELDDKKLEQVVQGYSVSTFGKRSDAVMKTRGAISNLCFVEIKTHRTQLLGPAPYRAGCWAPSSDLTSAVAQLQGTVQAAVTSIGHRFSGRDADGNPTGEFAFNYQPRSFLVCGNLQQFSHAHGVNEDQVRSFELYRRNTSMPEIVTFDELHERARFIVEHSQVGVSSA
jgi:hypothetical protein